MTDHLEDKLASLPAHDVDPRVGEKIRRRAQATLREERDLVGQTWTLRFRRAWDFFEPVMSTGVVGSYLFWMVLRLMDFSK